MKTKTQNNKPATIAIDFTGVDAAMHADAMRRITLIDVLRKVWKKYVNQVTVKEFRDQFTAYASGLGYGETHIKRILADVDELRIRKTSKTMSETKKAKAAASKKAAEGPTFSFAWVQKQLDALVATKQLDKKSVKIILTALAK